MVVVVGIRLDVGELCDRGGVGNVVDFVVGDERARIALRDARQNQVTVAVPDRGAETELTGEVGGPVHVRAADRGRLDLRACARIPQLQREGGRGGIVIDRPAVVVVPGVGSGKQQARVKGGLHEPGRKVRAPRRSAVDRPVQPSLSARVNVERAVEVAAACLGARHKTAARRNRRGTRKDRAHRAERVAIRVERTVEHVICSDVEVPQVDNGTVVARSPLVKPRIEGNVRGRRSNLNLSSPRCTAVCGLRIAKGAVTVKVKDVADKRGREDYAPCATRGDSNY